jgi:hypothetical protein
VINVIWKGQMLLQIGATDETHCTQGSEAMRGTVHWAPGYFQVQRPNSLLLFPLGISLKTHLQRPRSGVKRRVIIPVPLWCRESFKATIG